jgi:hypothetical protein
MKFIFTGDRGDISLITGDHTLRRGAVVELTQTQADDLIAKGFPIELSEKEEEVKKDGI